MLSNNFIRTYISVWRLRQLKILYLLSVFNFYLMKIITLFLNIIKNNNKSYTAKYKT